MVGPVVIQLRYKSDDQVRLRTAGWNIYVQNTKRLIYVTFDRVDYLLSPLAIFQNEGIFI